MATVGLRIVSPVHGAVVVGPQTVSFFAVLSDGPQPGTLFARWYSSLPSRPGVSPTPNRPPTTGDLDNLALHPQVELATPSTSLTFDAALLVGSQTITVAVKDRAGDDEAAMRTVQSGGTSGGGQDSPAPCVVHVLVASSRMPAPPATPGAAVIASRKDGLWAEAPPTWKTDDVNRFRYSWTFEKPGTVIVLDPDPAALTFHSRTDAEPPRVGFTEIPATPAVPATPQAPAVPDGTYQLTLRVVYGPDLAAAQHDPNVTVRKHEHVLQNVQVTT